MRRIRVCTVGDDEDADDETEGDAESEAEALSGCVVHVTQATFVLYRGVNPLGRGSDAKRHLTGVESARSAVQP